MAETAALSWSGRPRGLPQQARILDIQAENHRTASLVLDLHLDAQPGQFVMAWLPGIDEKPFSLAAASPVTLTVARVGPFSALLHSLRCGDRIGIRGPFGHGFTVEGSRALLAGGGYGVAPLAFLAKKLRDSGVTLTVAIGARTADDLLVGRFRAMGVEPLLTTEDGTRGTLGRITQVVEPIMRAGQVDVLYACGPNGMLEALEQISLRAGIPAQLGWEAHMRCGIGICGSCHHGDSGLLVCRDGPVLPAGAGVGKAY